LGPSIAVTAKVKKHEIVGKKDEMEIKRKLIHHKLV
jgi:hypothetical protein